MSFAELALLNQQTCCFTIPLTPLGEYFLIGRKVGEEDRKISEKSQARQGPLWTSTGRDVSYAIKYQENLMLALSS